VEDNLVFAGAAICLIALSITLLALVDPPYALGLH
jgi:hypothetical protein